MRYSKAIITFITHKNNPDNYELISLIQGLKVLNKHKFALVVPENLDIANYVKIFNEHKVNFQVEYFGNNFFGTLDNYSRFLLSTEFYERFVEWEFLLIFHLDCFIFKDELDYWCEKGYDYIAAPWFKGYDCLNKTDKLWLVGNGGLSLRKISTFIEVLKRPKLRLSLLKSYEYHTLERNLLTKIFKIPYIIFIALGYKNNKKYYLQYPFVEDKFWSYIATNIKNPINTIPLSDSIKFAFDGNPSILYKKNNCSLPFGCHAWFKYSDHNLEFWIPIIEKECKISIEQ